MKLEQNLMNKWVKIISVNGIDSNTNKKLHNIGMKLNEVFFVLNISSNSKMIHIIVNEVEYAFRLSDLNFIEVEEVNEYQY